VIVSSRCPSEQYTCVAAACKRPSRPQISLTSPPDRIDSKDRRTAGHVRGRRQPGPGSAQDRPNSLREARPLGDAVLTHRAHAASLGAPAGEAARLAGGRELRAHARSAAGRPEANLRRAGLSADAARGCSSHACAAGVLRDCQEVTSLGAVAVQRVRALGCCGSTRPTRVPPRGGASRGVTRVDLVGVRAHGGAASGCRAQ